MLNYNNNSIHDKSNYERVRVLAEKVMTRVRQHIPYSTNLSGGNNLIKSILLSLVRREPVNSQFVKIFDEVASWDLNPGDCENITGSHKVYLHSLSRILSLQEILSLLQKARSTPAFDFDSMN